MRDTPRIVYVAKSALDAPWEMSREARARLGGNGRLR